MDAPTIVHSRRLGQKVGLLHTGNELGRGMRGNQKSVGNRAYGWRFRALVTRNGEQCLMLLRWQTLGAGRSFAEGQETPQLVSESCDCRVLFSIKLALALTL